MLQATPSPAPPSRRGPGPSVLARMRHWQVLAYVAAAATAVSEDGGKSPQLLECHDHTLLIMKQGDAATAWTWGHAADGILGRAGTSHSPIQVAEWQADSGAATIVKDIASGCTASEYTVIVTEDGRVFSWGTTKYGQLGLRSGIISGKKVVPTARQLQQIEFNNRAVASVSCGENHALAVTTDGVVYGWGYSAHYELAGSSNELEPKLISVPGTVVQVSAGATTSFAVTDAGLVYSWGTGNGGELGHAVGQGQHTDVETSPHLITSTGVRFSQVRAGEGFTIGLSVDGQVYSWGRHTGDVLGLGPRAEETNVYEPTLVELNNEYGLPEASKVVGIDAAPSYAGVLTESGRVYVWGRTPYRGHGNEAGVYTVPQLVFPAENNVITSAFCLGDEHMVFAGEPAVTAGTLFVQYGLPLITMAAGLLWVGWYQRYTLRTDHELVVLHEDSGKVSQASTESRPSSVKVSQMTNATRNTSAHRGGGSSRGSTRRTGASKLTRESSKGSRRGHSGGSKGSRRRKHHHRGGSRGSRR